MARPIKFRARKVAGGEWVYGTYAKLASHFFIIDDIGRKHGIDPRTLGQFTGLFDKNGKEIYEGDVLTSASKKYLSDNYEVIWLDEEDESGSFFGWYCQQNGNPRIRFTLTHKPAHSSMVIDDIRENPELLK